jgi:hypothetical protein
MFQLGSLVSEYRSRNTRNSGAAGSSAPSSASSSSSSSESPMHSIAMPSHARPPLLGLALPPAPLHAAPTRLHAPAASSRSAHGPCSVRVIVAGIALLAIVALSISTRFGASINRDAHASVESGASLDWYASPPPHSALTFHFAATGSIENGTWAGGFARAADSGEAVAASPWHDIPLVVSLGAGAAHALHFVCEIPRFTRDKFEVDKADATNRIRQDRDAATGMPRISAYGDYFFNYGMLPQTFEDPSVVAPGTQYFGDGDPIDALELGSRQLSVGALVAVKPVRRFA